MTPITYIQTVRMRKFGKEPYTLHPVSYMYRATMHAAFPYVNGAPLTNFDPPRIVDPVFPTLWIVAENYTEAKFKLRARTERSGWKVKFV